MKPTSTRRSSFPSVLAGLCLLPVSSAIAEEESSSLEALIVSALRTPREASTVTSAVTALDPDELQNQGILQIRDSALFHSP
jgi:outer membrane cobalamin receptor